jgi:hypothetical protein
MDMESAIKSGCILACEFISITYVALADCILSRLVLLLRCGGIPDHRYGMNVVIEPG